MNNCRYFFDMDGTLFKWNNVPYYERLYEEGYYKNLDPNMDLINTVNALIEENPDQVFIASKYLTDSKYAYSEKRQSIQQYLPNLKHENIILIPNDEQKEDHIPGGVGIRDILIDDYTNNLLDWKEAGGSGIKYLNGINHTRESWKGEIIQHSDPKQLEELKGISNLLLQPNLRELLSRDMAVENKGFDFLKIEQLSKKESMHFYLANEQIPVEITVLREMYDDSPGTAHYTTKHSIVIPKNEMFICASNGDVLLNNFDYDDFNGVGDIIEGVPHISIDWKQKVKMVSPIEYIVHNLNTDIISLENYLASLEKFEMVSHVLEMYNELDETALDYLSTQNEARVFGEEFKDILLLGKKEESPETIKKLSYALDNEEFCGFCADCLHCGDYIGYPGSYEKIIKEKRNAFETINKFTELKEMVESQKKSGISNHSNNSSKFEKEQEGFELEV